MMANKDKTKRYDQCQSLDTMEMDKQVKNTFILQGADGRTRGEHEICAPLEASKQKRTS